MKLPRDVAGSELAKALAKFGFVVTRQSGSHMRLTRAAADGEQHLTIPAHQSLKAGTLSAILSDAARALAMTKDDLVRAIWP